MGMIQLIFQIRWAIKSPGLILALELLVFTLFGVTEYQWKFIGTDINLKSIESSNNIVSRNPSLKNKVECRLQKNKENIFYGIIGGHDKFDLSICNPPFHASAKEAREGTRRKVKNLSGKEKIKPVLNFAGIANELIYEGGEYRFIQNMITESKVFAHNCYWFSTLVSKQFNLKRITTLLEKEETKQIRIIPIGTGNKSTRIVAWTFLSGEEQKEWAKKVYHAKSKINV